MGFFSDMWSVIFHGDTQADIDKEYAEWLSETKSARTFVLELIGVGGGVTLLIILAWKLI
jgi:hypothetical protein